MPAIITKGLGSFGSGPPAPSGSAFLALSAMCFPTYVEITFSAPAVVSNLFSNDISAWRIVGSQSPRINSVSVVGGKVRLGVDEHQQGALYTVYIPREIRSVTYDPLLGPPELTYLGVGSPPAVLTARSVSSRLIVVSYSEPVDQGALVASNYTISPSRAVFSVKKVNETQYELQTEEAVNSTTYTVTVSNVRDLKGNLI